jgi:hypothetical protein
MPASYPVISLDLDHTIALYHDRALSRLIYSCVTEALITICSGRYPPCIFEERLALNSKFHSELSNYEPPAGEPSWIANRARVLEDSWELFQRGLVVDFRTGDLLKLSNNGIVLKAWHGLNPCSDADIERNYPSRLWPFFPQLERMEKIPHAFVQLTAFDWPSQLSICQCVHYIDSLNKNKAGAGAGAEAEAVASSENSIKYAQIMQDHINSFDYIFDNVKALNSGRGGYFDAIIQSPLTYVIPRPRIASMFHAIRNAKVKDGKRQALVLVTNSHMQYAELILNVALGPDWRKIFDLIIVNAQKGGFFTMERPFKDLDVDRKEDGGISKSIELVLSSDEDGRIYTSGNHKVLKQLTLALMDAAGNGTDVHSITAHLSSGGTHVERISVISGGSNSSDSFDILQPLQPLQPSVALYVGDHLHGDVHSAMKANWDAVAVLEDFSLASLSDASSYWGPPLQFNAPEASWVESLAASATACVNNIESILAR